jgi:hypothetical protein
MKENRGDEKDRMDLRLMRSALRPSKFAAVTTIHAQYSFLRLKARRSLLVMLRKFGVYSYVQKVYRWVRNRSDG